MLHREALLCPAIAVKTCRRSLAETLSTGDRQLSGASKP